MIFDFLFYGVLFFIIFNFVFLFIKNRNKIRKSIIIKGVVADFEVNQDAGEEEPISYILRTKFEYSNTEFMIEDIVPEKLFKYKVGKPIDVYLNQNNPLFSTTLDNYSISEFIGKFIKQFVIIFMLIIFKIIINYYEK